LKVYYSTISNFSVILKIVVANEDGKNQNKLFLEVAKCPPDFLNNFIFNGVIIE